MSGWPCCFLAVSHRCAYSFKSRRVLPLMPSKQQATTLVTYPRAGPGQLLSCDGGGWTEVRGGTGTGPASLPGACQPAPRNNLGYSIQRVGLQCSRTQGAGRRARDAREGPIQMNFPCRGGIPQSRAWGGGLAFNRAPALLRRTFCVVTGVFRALYKTHSRRLLGPAIKN
jgi:hypothetical protein